MRNTTPTPIRPPNIYFLRSSSPTILSSLHTHPYSTKPLKPHIHHQQHPTQPHHLSPTIPKQTKPIHTYRVDKTPYQPPSPPTHSLSSTSEIDASRAPRPPGLRSRVQSVRKQSRPLPKKVSSLKTSKWAITTTLPHSAVREACPRCAEDLSIR